MVYGMFCMLRHLWIVGNSKKKAKHNAAESLLSLVEGLDIESSVDEAQYVFLHQLQFLLNYNSVDTTAS